MGMVMKIGDAVECAIWLDGTETLDMLRQWKSDCVYLMARLSETIPKLGPVEFEIKRPGQDRVPPVPDHISGDDVRLLVATANVVGFEPVLARPSFLSELEPKDLARLRTVTRVAHAQRNPGSELPDDICDKMIEALGPVTGGEMVRKGVDGRTVH